MNFSRRLQIWVRSLCRRDEVKREIDEELRFHLEQRTAENVAAGMSAEDAAREARKRFGHFQKVREDCRAARGASFGETTWQDVRIGVRMLRKHPGFAASAMLTLALGITVNGIVFNFANEFYLRPLPAQSPDRLVVVAEKAPTIDYQIPFSYPDTVEFRRMVESRDATASDLARVFSGLMAYKELSVHWSQAGETTQISWIHAVTDNYFSLLGTQPELGRFFMPDEVKAPGADPVIVLTHDTWCRRFGADPATVGQTIKLDGQTFTVVGITRPGFVGASWGTALSGFVPVTMLTTLVGSWALSPGNSMTFLVGRLQPKATLREAQAAVNVAMGRLMQANPGLYLRNTQAVVLSEPMSRPSPYISHHVPAIIVALIVLAMLVLMVAAANVSNLLYARAASREHETAIRLALGASRGRLLRSLLTESVILALGAGLIGMLASLWLMPVVVALLPTSATAAPPVDTGIDWRPLVFGFFLSLLTGMAAGLLPALKATDLTLQPMLKQKDAVSRTFWLQPWHLLVVGQVSVSCVVLVCAGMTVHSLIKMLKVPLGFDAANLVVASLDLGKQRYEPEQGRQFQQRLLAQVRALPGVQTATLADFTPFDTRIGYHGGILPEGYGATDHLVELSVPCVVADQAALDTLRLPLIAGRDFEHLDGFGAPLVAIINQALADQFWPGESPIGKHISVEGDKVEVVGLIGEVRYTGVKDRKRPLLIQPLAQNYRSGLTLMVRSTNATAPLVSAIERLVRRMDPDLPLSNTCTMEEQIANSPSGLMPYRIGATFSISQGLIALFLAGLGIFGLVSFTVTRRTREIGIRMALGATRAGVMRLIARETLILSVAGLITGGLLSQAVIRRLAGLLFEVSPTDAAVYSVVIAVVMAATLLAVWLPARRATRIDPMNALRCE
jgi:putative ABC transport system permease protein